jgi:hypothetical protein
MQLVPLRRGHNTSWPNTPPSDADDQQEYVTNQKNLGPLLTKQLSGASGGSDGASGHKRSEGSGHDGASGHKRSEGSGHNNVTHAAIGGGDSAEVATMAVGSRQARASRTGGGESGAGAATRLGSVLHRDFTTIGGGGGGGGDLPQQAAIDVDDLASILAAAQQSPRSPLKLEDAGSDACEMQVLLASLEIGTLIKKERGGGGDGVEKKEESAPLKFKSYVEAELWFGGVQVGLYKLNPV